MFTLCANVKEQLVNRKPLRKMLSYVCDLETLLLQMQTNTHEYNVDRFEVPHHNVVRPTEDTSRTKQRRKQRSGPRGISLLRKCVRDFFRTKGFLRIFDGFSLQTKGFLPKAYEIFWSEMPLDQDKVNQYLIKS